MAEMQIGAPRNLGPETMRSLRTQFFSLVVTDRAALHAMMLIAASCFVRERNPKPHIEDLLQLRHAAIQETSSALAEEGRCTSDALIAAVVSMASYEASFGDHHICEVHMKGLVAMVESRGGLSALGLDGLLENHITWTDWHNSSVTGKLPCFGYDSTIKV